MVFFCMLFFVGIGVGKISFMNILIVYYVKLYNKFFGDCYVYFWMFGEKYWNSFVIMCWVVCIDDVVFVNFNMGSEDFFFIDILLGVGNLVFNFL